MPLSGYGAQIVWVTDSHTYELDENALKQILMNDKIKDIPVVVVSVAGAYRGGKSFLMNFFLRYLTSSVSARNDGSWMGDENEPLVGFVWRSGIKRTTMGIQLWSEPIVSTLPNGDRVAVLLMDTQGTFDSTSTVRDCSTIFALSTLLSSVQIYNLSQNIQEDDLQHLQLFIEFGKLIKDKGATAFQVLEFLVRDWQFPEDYPYGANGGDQLLEEKMQSVRDVIKLYNIAVQIKPNHDKDMQDLRRHIRSSFEKVSCFLMPHPGFKVLKAKGTGKLSDIGADFKTHLDGLAKSLFNPEKLMPKTVNGVQIKTQDLLNYFQVYVNLLRGNTLPSPKSIYEATIEAGFLSALKQANDIYETGMDADCGPSQPSVPAGDLKVLHTKYMTAAIDSFMMKKKMGTLKESNKYLDKLNKGLEKRLHQFGQSNLAKTQTAIENGKDAYEEAIQQITKDQPLCVHPQDLQKVHKTGFDAAINAFDRARKRFTNEPDSERTQFINSFEKRYALLQLTNDKNNKITVALIRHQYWDYMQKKSSLEIPLSKEDFEEEHEKARKKALEDFDSKRNIPNTYTEDVHRYNLTTMIDESFIQLKAISESVNKMILQEALFEYDEYMRTVMNIGVQCMHPTGLERENQNGLCRALVKLRPTKECSEGFDVNNKDEKTLREILRQRFMEIESINFSANEAAIQSAFNVFVASMEKLCRPSAMWVLIIPYFLDKAKRGENYEKSKAKAYEMFYNKRRSGSLQYPSDNYKDHLDEMMEAYNRRTMSSYDETFQSGLGTVKQIASVVSLVGGL